MTVLLLCLSYPFCVPELTTKKADNKATVETIIALSHFSEGVSDPMLYKFGPFFLKKRVLIVFGKQFTKVVMLRFLGFDTTH